MSKSLTKILLISIFAALLLTALPPPAQALNIDDYSKTIADEAGYQTTAVESQTYLDTTIGKIIAFVLGFVGIIFFIMILLSGFQWMTAGGNDEKAKQAMGRVVNATIGLIIVLAAYIITYFVFTAI